MLAPLRRAPSSKPPTPAVRTAADLKGRYSQTALVFQGGGALGAYQAGVYQALSEAGCEPDWLSGISIGSINAAIIAGAEPEDRLPRLRKFWETPSSVFAWPDLGLGDQVRRVVNEMSAMNAAVFGQPGFFKPRLVPPLMQPHGAPGALSFYDTSPLRTTLLSLIDFERINARKTRLSLGAVNIRSGNFEYFDNFKQQITVDHVMASGALPPGFPPVEINGESYWDGGLVSNTPLVPILEGGTSENTLVFQVDLFNARGDMPGDLFEAEARRKQIIFSSRTRLNTDTFRQKHALRCAIVELFEQLPAEAQADERMRALRALGDDREVAIVHLIYRGAAYEGLAVDYEFSNRSMTEHWQDGLDDAHLTLSRPRWLEASAKGEAVRVFDLTRDSDRAGPLRKGKDR